MSDKIPNLDYDADEVIENFKSKFKWPSSDEIEIAVKPPKLALKLLLSFLTTVVVGAVAYYIMIPALNFKSPDFYTFFILLIAVFTGSFYLFIGAGKKVERKEYFKKRSIVPIIMVAVLVVVMVVGWLVGNARKTVIPNRHIAADGGRRGRFSDTVNVVRHEVADGLVRLVFDFAGVGTVLGLDELRLLDAVGAREGGDGDALAAKAELDEPCAGFQFARLGDFHGDTSKGYRIPLRQCTGAAIFMHGTNRGWDSGYPPPEQKRKERRCRAGQGW